MIQNELHELFSSPNTNGEETISSSRFESQYLSDTPYFISNSFESNSENESYDSISDKSNPGSEDLPSKHMALRASTAPARPLTELEEFRRSSDFLLLEHTVICASQLPRRLDNKYDLDSDQGQKSCKKLLNQIERLCETFKAACISREYRKLFSKAYRVLYSDGALCYLTEILDSAQESFPYLYVNGEKYVFSTEVLQAGINLYQAFNKTQGDLREIYNRICEESFTATVEQIHNEICASLSEFDRIWIKFEQLYVHELMAIESDARRFVTEAIALQKEMVEIEGEHQQKHQALIVSKHYHATRAKFATLLGKINSVANIEGKGRDDLSIDILLSAEGILRRVSSNQSQCVRNLADKIKQAFATLREVFRKYEENIEIVDPQLKNNPELVEALVKYEGAWERGKVYFLSSKKCNKLVFLSNMIETTAGMYSVFREQLECSDSELFVTIPQLLVLKCLENEDRGICKGFCPPMFDENEQIGMIWKRVKRSYNLGKLSSSSDAEYIEVLTALAIGQPLEKNFREQVVSKEFDNLDYTLNKIKTVSMEIHRHKPTDWNRFLDVVLS